MSLASPLNAPTVAPGRTPLDVIEGAWPADIGGAAYIIGPAPFPGVPVFYAPGMLHRLDLRPGEGGTLAWTSGFLLTEGLRVLSMLPPAMRQDPRTMALIGPVPNAANTALVPIGGGRMLATFDAGRPVEVDPETLSYVTSVGYAREWKVGAPGAVQPGIFTSAHPFYDPFDKQVYTVNQVPSVRDGTTWSRKDLDMWVARWDGEGQVERWHVAGPDFCQYVHEVVATKSFIAWFDSSSFLNEPGERLGLPRTSRPQKPYTDLAIVRKADLKPATPRQSPYRASAPEVQAVVVRIPLEATHMFADYDDDGEHLTVYIGHSNSAELTRTIKPGDINFFTKKPVDPSVVGQYTSVDIIPLGKYRINAVTGQIVEQKLLLELDTLWGLGFWTRDMRAAALGASKELFVSYLGHDPAAVTTEMIDAYGPHPFRIVPVDALPSTPKPSYLTRIDLATMTVADRFELPRGKALSSPTWIPSTRGAAGYVLAPVFGDGDTETWLFRADAIAAGPIAKLGKNGFRLPMTLHTAWVPEVGPRASRYRVDFAEDIGDEYLRLPEEVRSAVKAVIAAGG